MAELKNVSFEAANFETLIPERLLNDADDLALLLKAYYEYQFEEGNPSQILQNTLAKTDIDNAVDNFLREVEFEVGQGFISRFEADKENVYKNIQEFYNVKGSIDSFKYLFRVLFNIDVNVYFPNESILKVSDGRWRISTSIHLNFADQLSYDAFLTLWEQDTITLTAFIVNEAEQEYPIEVLSYRVVNENEYVVEIFIERTELPELNGPITIKFNDDLSVAVEPILSRFEITAPGFGFKPGQSYNVFDGSGSGTSFEISEVSEKGSVQDIEFLSYGYGYNDPVVVTIFPNNFFEDVFGDEVEVESEQDFVDTLEDTIEIYGDDSYAEPGYFAEDYTFTLTLLRTETDTISFDSGSYSGVQSTPASVDFIFKITDNLQITCEGDTPTLVRDVTNHTYANPENYPEYLTGGGATIVFYNQNIVSIGGFYEGNKGHLSDAMFIQDNFFYQPYSYVLSATEQRDEYDNAVYKTAHPAGTKMFSEYNIENEFSARRATVEDIEKYEP